MTSSFPYLSSNQWVLFDDDTYLNPSSGLKSLALEDTLVRWLPQFNLTQTHMQPTGAIHFYPLAPTIILGAKDGRLPQIEAGVRFLQEQGYDVVMRPHGGLAVVSDSGVLNFSMVSDMTHFPLTIDQAYEQMIQVIQLVLYPFNITVDAYEIVDSYCPGSFDIVVAGQKIGGIAQRRSKMGVSTSAYLGINGNQDQRSLLIREFYQLCQADDSYPRVNPAAMTTIEAVIGQKMSMTQFKQKLIAVFNQFSQVRSGDYQQPALQATFDKAYKQALERTESISS